MNGYTSWHENIAAPRSFSTELPWAGGSLLPWSALHWQDDGRIGWSPDGASDTQLVSPRESQQNQDPECAITHTNCMHESECAMQTNRAVPTRLLQ